MQIYARLCGQQNPQIASQVSASRPVLRARLPSAAARAGWRRQSSGSAASAWSAPSAAPGSCRPPLLTGCSATFLGRRRWRARPAGTRRAHHPSLGLGRIRAGAADSSFCPALFPGPCPPPPPPDLPSATLPAVPAATATRPGRRGPRRDSPLPWPGGVYSKRSISPPCTLPLPFPACSGGVPSEP